MPTEKIRTIIVEDEPLILQRIQTLVREDSDFQVVASCSTGSSATHAISSLRPDLILLDIQLPGHDGFSVMDIIESEQKPKVIVISAFDHAIKAFKYQVTDYLLKPFDRARFREALSRVKEELKNGKHQQYLTCKKNGKVVLIRFHDIKYLQSEANYVRVFSNNGEHTVRSTMHEIEGKLDDRLFARIHRSYIVNIDEITELSHLYQGDYSITLRSGKVLVSSAKYRQTIKSILGK